jgi:DNA modification methylase
VTVYYQDATLTLLLGDAVEQLRTLPDSSVSCVVTSPPYFGHRDYEGHPEQIGLEETPAEYIARLAEVFAEVRRVLATDGTCWLNLCDSYASNTKGTGGGPAHSTLTRHSPEGLARSVDRQHKPPHRIVAGVSNKNLLFIPERVAMVLQDAGWFVRNKIVWSKPNAQPEPVRDRLSNRYELVFLLTRSRRYWFDLDPIREPLARPEALAEGIVFGGNNGGAGKVGSSARRSGGHRSVYGATTVEQTKGRNPGDVWEIATTPLPEAHFAAFPIALPRRCILTGCKPGGTVLDPFSGAGTTAKAAQQLGRKAIGIDLIAKYHDIALKRMSDAPLPLEDGEEAS